MTMMKSLLFGRSFVLALSTCNSKGFAFQLHMSASSSSVSSSLPSSMKATVQIAVSVDGYIADKNGDIDFLERHPTPEGEDFGFGEFMKSIDAIVMGRNTFDKVVSFGEEQYPYGDTKLVVWSRDTSSVMIPDHLKEKKTVSASSLPPSELLQMLESEGHKNAYIDGGITIQKFLQDNAIHQLILTRIPTLLGDGIPLFGNAFHKQLDLHHVKTKAYENGFVTSTYDVRS